METAYVFLDLELHRKIEFIQKRRACGKTLSEALSTKEKERRKKVLRVL